jgi:hypothetical protein
MLLAEVERRFRRARADLAHNPELRLPKLPGKGGT